MNLSVSEETGRRLERQVNSGRYETPEEVIRSGLDLLESECPELAGGVASHEELEACLLEGVADLDRGEAVSGEAALAEIRAAVAQRLSP
ncbi:MAG TPA: type II toxin-antitoxin system ParD family antitoxin [Verrucomicrobiota bacterium]|nr:type II toxin-antitoxin system ParD family antitoxin [Verrucomicrobiota bacterium]